MYDEKTMMMAYALCYLLPSNHEPSRFSPLVVVNHGFAPHVQ